MTKRQSCETCQWFQSQLHATIGNCDWEKHHPEASPPSGMFLLTWPHWGRLCTVWEERMGAVEEHEA